MGVLVVENVMEKYMIMEDCAAHHQLMPITQAVLKQNVSKLEQDNALGFE